jgi:hypothetical protein
MKMTPHGMPAASPIFALEERPPPPPPPLFGVGVFDDVGAGDDEGVDAGEDDSDEETTSLVEDGSAGVDCSVLLGIVSIVEGELLPKPPTEDAALVTGVVAVAAAADDMLAAILGFGFRTHT